MGAPLLPAPTSHGPETSMAGRVRRTSRTLGSLNNFYSCERSRFYPTIWFMNRRNPFAVCCLIICLAVLRTTTAEAQTVRYYHTDINGNVVVVTDQNANVIERRVYEPYGLPLDSILDGPGFTGHDMDGETGLIYMQQRYYDPLNGRFISVDPVTVRTQSGDGFNRYHYASNNPFSFSDPDGRWPKSIHERIIDQAFPGLSDGQRQTLKDASSRMDSVLRGGQRVANSPQHAMRSPSQAPQAASSATESFIANQIAAARTAQGDLPNSIGGIRSDSLSHVGNAIHTVTDRTSPAHTSGNGEPMVWSGLGGKTELIMAGAHASSEATISSEHMDAAISAARQAFGDAYGPKLRDQAIKR